MRSINIESCQIKKGKLTVSNLGYPRIGGQNELGTQLESYWKGEINAVQLKNALKKLRIHNLKKQQQAGIDWIPVGDYSLYDHVLDHSVAFGLIPARFKALKQTDEFTLYFAMARGTTGAAACEMSKWFNTSYHYIIPEWESDLKPQLLSNPWLTAFNEARHELGITAKPALIGPYTYAVLSKGYLPSEFGSVVKTLLPVYAELLSQLQEAGATVVQIDEPALSGNVPSDHWLLLYKAYTTLHDSAPQLTLFLQTYFDGISDMPTLYSLPVKGIGLDFIHDNGRNLRRLQQFRFPDGKLLGAGIIDGRNLWAKDDSKALTLLHELEAIVGKERLVLQPAAYSGYLERRNEASSI